LRPTFAEDAIPDWEGETTFALAACGKTLVFCYVRGGLILHFGSAFGTVRAGANVVGLVTLNSGL